MDSAFLASPQKALEYFQVSEKEGLSDTQVKDSVQKHGRNGNLHTRFPNVVANNASVALPEDPPTPLWELVLEQFKDQLVIILLGSAAVSFVLALFEDGEGWTAFVDPLVVRLFRQTGHLCKLILL